MYRLLFWVREVHLRLREEVDVQVLIKKGQENFVVPQRAKLVNGVASFNAHAQFFLSEANPTFEIFVMILHQSAKKFAGMCSINLNDWQVSQNNETISLLLKSPDSSASINFSFMYLNTDVNTNPRNLMSVNELESLKKAKQLKQFQIRDVFLHNENSRLSHEIETLKLKNQYLVEDKQEMEVQHIRCYQGYEAKLKIQEKNLQNYQDKAKKTFNKIEWLVNQYGEAELKLKVGGVVQDYSKNNCH